MARTIRLCVILSVITACATAARILAVLPLPAKSHHILFQAILRTLAERGHEVVSYSPFALTKHVDNYTNIDLKIKSLDNKLTTEQLFRFIDWTPYNTAIHIMEESVVIMDNIFNNEKIVQLINSNETFDLVIVEAFYAQEAFLGFGHKFKAPVVNIHPFGGYPVVNLAAGSPLNLPNVPDFNTPFSDQMTLFERMYNAFAKLFPLYFYYKKNLPYQQRLMSEAFKDTTMPPLEELMSGISLFLTNAHPYVGYSQPTTPNQIPLGGIHLSSKRNILPEEIRNFLNGAEKGVIYFSLGSIINDHLLGKQFFDNFINVFRRLPQRVLWKTNSQYLNLSSNIMTAKWLPQQDILAHPNVAVFLTHGGLFSMHEAVHAGVPVVCIPFFVDQPMNAKFYEAKEVGVRIPFNDLSEEIIYSALEEVLNNTKYKRNMVQLSRIFNDQPQTPADRLLFWIDYVLKHGGAHHLTPASARMRLYQLWCLDVVAALLALVCLVATVVFIVVRRIIAYLTLHITKANDLAYKNIKDIGLLQKNKDD